DFFCYAVSLFGNRALIGAYQEDDNGGQSGAAYVFDFNNGLWSQSIKLTADDGAANNYFGASVNVLGNRAMIGAPGGDTGSAYVFAFDGIDWSQSEKLTASDGTPNDFFGFSLSQTTEHTLIGAKLDDELGASSGSAYVYLNHDVIFADGFGQ
ncbi:MAG: FG-GAP repeat protein, partial [Xanthomonadales bacterium]|nr:FG-GAP repeat protein [Xanthomonadales bacterium]